MLGFDNITVAIDVSDGDRLVGTQPHLSSASRGALEKAAWVAKQDGGRLHVLTSLDVDPHAESLLLREFAAGSDCVLRAAQLRVDHFVEPLRTEGIDVTVEVAFGRASTAILADVERHARDLVVVGTRERGMVARNLLGSTSLRLLRRCPAAVWVARSAPRGGINVILAPIDLGEMGEEIVRVAESLARALSAHVLVVHAIDPHFERFMVTGGADAPETRRVAELRRIEARAAIDGIVGSYRSGVEIRSRMTVGEPAAVILAEASRLHPDLVVMSSVVHGAVSGMLLGSTAERVLPQLATSLLVLKPGSR